MRMKQNNNTWEKVFEIGTYTIRISRSQFAVYNGYEAIINWQW